jgi:hypothetical protein
MDVGAERAVVAPIKDALVASSAALTDAAKLLLSKAKYTMESTRSNELRDSRPNQVMEATLDGHKATELVCWFYVRGSGDGCTCGGSKAHICHRACGGAINAALGGKHICRKHPCSFEHPEPELVRAELEKWWIEKSGSAPVWSVASAEAAAATAPNNALKGGSRSLESSHSGGGGGHEEGGGSADGVEERRCTVPMEVQLERIRKHEADSAHVHRFLREPFLGAWLEDEALRSLLSMRKAAKEISEAYGAAEQVLAMLREARGGDGGSSGGGGSSSTSTNSGSSSSSASNPTGAGVTLLDVCSGKGLTAVLLSFLLPEATILLFDSNGAMDLAHVAARPRMRFSQLDLFAADAIEQVGAACAATEPHTVIAIGTHLCGALSPRLIDMALRVQPVDALILSPCCLRGALGAGIARAAKPITKAGLNDGPYHLLVATLAALCRSQLAPPTDNPMTAATAAEEPPSSAANASTSAANTPTGSGACQPCAEDALRAGASVRVEYDFQVISPKNAFIVMRKRASRGCPMG